MTNSELAGLLVATMVATALPAHAANPTVTRVAMLPLVGRTTVVIDLSEPVAHVEHAQAQPNVVVVEGGPVAAGITDRRLEPAGPSPLVSRASLSAFTRHDGAWYFRLRIDLAAQAVHGLRIAGSRLYVDVSPPAEPATQPDKATAIAPQPPPVGVKPEKAPRTELEATAKPAEAADSEAAGADPEAAYRALESTTLQRGRILAARPDVKGLLRLKEDVQKRDVQLGRRQPDLVSRLLDELTRLTDEARALQLDRDRGVFLKKE